MVQQTLKRKRQTSTTDEDAQLIEKIKGLEQNIRQDKRHLNDILFILDAADSKRAPVIHSSIQVLGRIFIELIQSGSIPIFQDAMPTEEAQIKMGEWLLDKYGQYTDRLITLLNHKQVSLQLLALDILLLLVRTEANYMSHFKKKYIFAQKLYGRVVSSILGSPQLSDDLLQAFCEKYHLKYDDLRYYGYMLMADVFRTATGSLNAREAVFAKKRSIDGTRSDAQVLADNGYAILEQLKSFPSNDSEIKEFWTDVRGVTKERKNTEKPQHPVLQLSMHRKIFSECWLAYLKLPMTLDLYKRILLIMHKRILPFMVHPTLLMDFLTDSYNSGGATSLLALNALFTLIHKHNLDYPDFYKKLYALFDRNLLHVKYRARFFRLASIFLSSAYLPAYLVAAFIKRMSRLALGAPPAALATIIPFIYNLLQTHPACIVLIHRTPGDTEAEEAIQHALHRDPYIYEEEDPAKSNAIHSSLWEIQSLGNHYYANIASLSKIFSQPFNKPSYDLEDFVDHTYATLFKTETERRLKKTPAIEYYTEPTLFNADNDTLLQNWDMGQQHWQTADENTA